MIAPVVLSAAMLNTPSCSVGIPAGAPVSALVERGGGTIRVRLIGKAPRAVAVRYALTVSAGSNRSTQGGSARLMPNIAATLVDLTQSAGDDWSAMLDVWVEGGENYHLSLCVGDTVGERPDHR
jgi:hypothetical protein